MIEINWELVVLMTGTFGALAIYILRAVLKSFLSKDFVSKDDLNGLGDRLDEVEHRSTFLDGRQSEMQGELNRLSTRMDENIIPTLKGIADTMKEATATLTKLDRRMAVLEDRHLRGGNHHDRS